MEKLLCPSMMCANYENLEREVMLLEQAGIDIFHIDIMDGDFVPNIGMGLQDTALICKVANKPVDVHLMMQRPGRYIKMFADLGVSILYIHPQTETQPIKALQEIRSLGMKAGIAVSPEFGIAAIHPMLSLVDYVLVMTVVPGFAGQSYLDFVDDKIEMLLSLRKDKSKYDYKIIIDGACSPEKIKTLSEKGVDGFVLGTSALFQKSRDYASLLEDLRSM